MKISPQHLAALIAGRKRARAAVTPEMRFWAKVDKCGPDECWNWIGAMPTCDKDQEYGQIWWNGKVRRAHRVSFEIHNGPIPAGFHIDHLCRNTHCVNPAHLRAVTPHVNSTENNVSPFAVNSSKTHCKHGHEFTPENTALLAPRKKRNRHGRLVSSSRPTRVCLTCYPDYWKHAVVPREKPTTTRRPQPHGRFSSEKP